MKHVRLLLGMTIVLFMVQIFMLPIAMAEEKPILEKPSILIIPLHGASSSFHIREAAEEVSNLLNVDLYGAGAGISAYKPVRGHLPSAERMDLSIYDVVFVIGNSPVGYKLNPAIEMAKKKTTVIVVSPNYVTEGNVKISEHPWLEQYLDNRCKENWKRLMIYLGIKFCGIKEQVEEPVIYPDHAIYHPDAKKVFENLEDYLKWYADKSIAEHHVYDAEKPTIGILFHKNGYTKTKLELEDSLIREIENRGCNAISLYGCRAYQPARFFRRKNKPVVDCIISLTDELNYSSYDQGLEEAKSMGVPFLLGITNYYMTPQEWEKDATGLTKASSPVGTSIGGNRLGMFEPMVIGGRVVSDKGRDYNKPIDYQIEWRVERAIAWAKLRRMKNSDKKIAMVYYSQGGGKGNLGADIDAYIDVQASIAGLLSAMKSRGYNLGDKPTPDKDEVSRLMAEKGSNVGVWAKGELQERVKQGSVILIPEKKYLEWFNELPEDKRNAVIKEFEEPPGKIMVYKDDNNKKYLVIPRVKFGNIMLLPLPTVGWLQDKSTLYDEGAIPPHHQYIAFWFWLKKEFNAQIVLNFWRQITEMPGKASVSKHDWCGLFVRDMAHIGPIPMHWAITGPREKILYLPIDYMMTLVSSELYEKLFDLEKKLSLYQQTGQAALKEQYKKGIMEECKRLKLDGELKIDLNTIRFETLVKKLNDYLVQIKKEHMPYGTHTLSKTPQGKTLVQMLASMLGKEFKKHISKLNSQEGLNEKLIEEVILNRKSSEDAQKGILGQASKDVTKDLKLATDYAKRIDGCKIEIPRILDAFEGKYIPPGPTDGPIRNPDALPTGRNPYTYDERTMPTKEAWKIGKRMASELIDQHLKKHGKYPKKVAFVLWHAESTRQHGVMEAEIFYLLGVRPAWNTKGRVEDVELISRNELKRPRVDILVTTSGAYRSAHQSRMRLIDKAVHLVAGIDEPSNYIRDKADLIKKELLKGGCKESIAADLSMARVFSHAIGAHGVGLHNTIPAGNTWKDDKKISDHYIGRMGYMYGENVIGKKAKDVLRQNIKGVEAGVFSRSSNVLGVIDHDQPAAYFGGLEIAVRNTSGKKIDMYITNTRNADSPEVETLDHFFNRELRARNFNPKWIKGMMEHGYDGARYMEDFTNNLWMWDVTSPDMVTEDMWNEVNDVYINDKYKLNLKEYFDKNNPYALQDMISTMLEVKEKGYWHPTKEVLEKLAKIFAESIARHGVSGSYGSTDPSLHKDVSRLLSAMPDVKPELIKNYQENVDKAAVKLEKVKGYEMKEVKEKKEEKLSAPKVALAAIVIVLVIMLVVGRGLWKGMKG